jgi:hypothetical protein
MSQGRGGVPDGENPKRTVNVETLRKPGFSEDLINEAVRAEERGGYDVEPPAALLDRILPKPGKRMPDGTVYAGISPDTGRAMYTTPEDAPGTMKWKDAMKYAAKLDAHGHKDWRVPSKAELNVPFNNRAAIGGFDVTGSLPGGCYWSSTEYGSKSAWDQRFSHGTPYWTSKLTDSSLRCVRG